jgi:hypothetical protein
VKRKLTVFIKVLQTNSYFIFDQSLKWDPIVEAMATMAQVMKEQFFWDNFGSLFIFLVCGCNDVGHEIRLVDDGNKNQVVEKLNMNLLL